MLKTWVRAAFPLVASLLVVAGGIVTCVHDTPRQAPEGRSLSVPLRPFDLEVFKGIFNASSDEVRVLAMLSPT